MAVDSMLFQSKIAAGSYTAGTIIPMALVRGPAVVRDGNGKAKLKKIFTVADDTGLNTIVHVSNGSWVDEVISPSNPISALSLSKFSHNIQDGHDCDLIINSQFVANVEILETATTTAAIDVFCLIEIEYDAVPAVMNPQGQKGTPMTVHLAQTIPYTAIGNDLVWTSVSVDVFKAGYKYLMTDAFFDTKGVATKIGFISITGAAGQAGLERIIPVYASQNGLGFPIDYSTVLVKGPMNINYAVVAAANVPADVQIDFVRR